MHFVFTTLGYHPDLAGGAFRYVTELAEGLARRAHRVEVIYPSVEESGPRETTEHRNGVILHRFRIHRGTFWHNWLDRNRAVLARLRITLRDDPSALVVSCHGYFASAAVKSGGPMVSLFTGPWAEEFLQSATLSSRPLAREKLIAPLLRKVESGGLKRSRAILTISRYYEKNLSLWHPELRTPVQVIEGGVNSERFRPAENRAQMRARFGIGPKDFVFLAVRRLEARMGLGDLIDSFAPIAHEFPNAHLWIGGSGAQRGALEARIGERSLHGRAQLLGFIPEEELPLRYSAANCTVMPSIDLEGFGLATVESLACGAPVLGSRRGATPEILEPLDPNLLYSLPADLTAKMSAVVADPTSLPSREQCREFVLSRYSWERPINAFERICLALPPRA